MRDVFAPQDSQLSRSAADFSLETETRRRQALTPAAPSLIVPVPHPALSQSESHVQSMPDLCLV